MNKGWWLILDMDAEQVESPPGELTKEGVTSLLSAPFRVKMSDLEVVNLCFGHNAELRAIYAVVGKAKEEIVDGLDDAQTVRVAVYTPSSRGCWALLGTAMIDWRDSVTGERGTSQVKVKR